MRILFGEFAPDQPPHLSKGLQVAANVYPAINGYRPVKQFVAIQNALPNECRGASSFVSPNGTSIIIAGTSDQMYRTQASGWTSLATGFSTQGEDRWRFAQFGSLAIATNGVDNVWSYDLEASDAASLAGTPPKGKFLAVVKDFLVTGAIGGDVARLQWSGINDATWWTVGQRQADYQIMAAGGEITGIIGGEFGLILQRNRVMRMDYVGGNVIFAFSEISTNIGCVSIHSVIQSGQLAFWLSDNGWVMWDGAQIKPIGDERIDRFFRAAYDRDSWSDMSAAVDAPNNLVLWSMGDRIFAYNWALDRWSIINQAAEIIFGGVSLSLSLEELDLLYPSLDEVEGSLDDFIGGDPVFYVFNTSHVLGSLTGTNMAATLTTGDLELGRGREVRLRSGRPLTDAVSGITLTMGTRARLGDAVSDTAYSTLTASGDMPLRERGRYVRPSLTIAAGTDWTYIQGLELTGETGARR